SMATTGPRWQVEFLTVDGVEPARRRFDGLSDTTKQNAVIAAIEHVLIPEGIGVCASEWGRSLGGGLYELRIRHAADEIRRIRMAFDAGTAPSGRREAVLLRVDFTTAGPRRILLLSGYDKGRLGAGRRQQRSIAAARRLAATVRRRP
ncbi:MAG: hypothetical protein ACO4CZ_19990, partial [Planctomycetota bacterium]